MSPHVITISYAKRALVPGSRERLRMAEYATVLGTYHVIVFTKASEKFPKLQQEGNLFLHATNAHSKVGMLLKAYFIAQRIVKKDRQQQWVVSGQDPFATSMVTVALSHLKNTRLHVQVHGDVFNPHSYTSVSGLVGIARMLWGVFVVRQAKKVRVVSERIKRSLLEVRVPEEKITVVPIQADMEIFLAVGAKRDYRSAESVTVLYVGRFSPEKNVPLLIRAFAQVAKENPAVRLQLLGDGHEKKHLQSLVAKYDIESRVEFLEWTNDVAGVMAGADILCLSSFHEGYAMVLVEAMAAGLPVLTTSVGCAGEVLLHNEQGLIVSVDDETAYIAALTQLVHSEAMRERLGRSGYHTVVAHKQTPHAYLHAIQASFTI